jgi:hypothetical protein
MRRASIGLLLAAALFVCAPPAWAKEKSRAAGLEGTPTGEITLTWHGDPARGCAAAGVCDISGSIVVHPDDITVQGVVRPNGRFYPSRAGLLSVNPSVVRVQRQTEGATRHLCTDLVDATELELTPGELPGGRYSFGISNAFSFSDGLSAGRCTGPLPSQLKGVFPTATLQAARKGARTRAFQMSGRQPIAAGPFSGELVSTVNARLYRFSEESSSSDDGSERSHRRKPHTVRILEVQMSYGLAKVAGSLTTSFSGAAEPFCRPFDACGDHGSGTYSVASAGGSVELYATRVLHGRERVSRRSALRDLRAGRLDIGGDVIPHDGAMARISASVQYADGSSCTDTGNSLPLASMIAGGGAKSVRFLLGPPHYFDGGDPLRTICPGPDQDDVLGDRHSLAEGRASAAALAGRSLRVRLVPAPTFKSDGYTGTRSGEIDLDLVTKRFDVHVHRIKEYS